MLQRDVIIPHYEKNTTSGVITTYYYLGGKLVALRNGKNLRYVHQDSLGSTSVVTTSAGAQYGYTRYYPYGSTRDSSGSLDTDKKFTGQRSDATGLYYYGARYYDPTIGRFISADTIVPNPANPQSLNRYSYCFNNPLRYVDPTGHEPPPEIDWGYDTSTGQPLLPPPEAFEPGGYYNGQYGYTFKPRITISDEWELRAYGRGSQLGAKGRIGITVEYMIVGNSVIVTVNTFIEFYTNSVEKGVAVKPGAEIVIGPQEVQQSIKLGEYQGPMSFTTPNGDGIRLRDDEGVYQFLTGTVRADIPLEATTVDVRIWVSGYDYSYLEYQRPRTVPLPWAWRIDLATGEYAVEGIPWYMTIP